MFRSVCVAPPVPGSPARGAVSWGTSSAEVKHSQVSRVAQETRYLRFGSELLPTGAARGSREIKGGERGEGREGKKGE